jgi:hypothetical protein
MYKFNGLNFFNKNIFFIILFILLLLYIFYYGKLIVESFIDSANTSTAFDVPTLTKWSFPDSSSDWFKLPGKGSEKSYTYKDLGFSNTEESYDSISISFLINIVSGLDKWRTIFHFNNTENNCCNPYDRIPAMFVYPDNTTKFHIRYSTDSNGNDGFDPNVTIPMGIPSLITLVFNKNNFTFYLNENAVKSIGYGDILPRNSKTKIYIGDHFDGHGNDGNVLIKNFTVYDGALTEIDVKNIYNKLNELSMGSEGPMGPEGPEGPVGPEGPIGLEGPVGTEGPVGPQGLKGPMGPRGFRGPMGPKGISAVQFLDNSRWNAQLLPESPTSSIQTATPPINSLPTNSSSPNNSLPNFGPNSNGNHYAKY